MPRDFGNQGRGAEFRIKTREEVSAMLMAGYLEEEIAEKMKLDIVDVEEIIKVQSEKDPDAFEKLRKWRQKSFIDEAWKIVAEGQEMVLKGLRAKKGNETLSTASTAANIVILMLDRIRALETKKVTKDKSFELTREEKEGLKKAQMRIEEKSSEIEENNGNPT